MEYNAVSEEILEQHGMRKIGHFTHSRVSLSPQSRVEAVRKAAQEFRQYMLGLDKKVRFYQSINLALIPYPTKYGLLNVGKDKSPYLHIMNRLFVIQYESDAGLKTLLFSPSDIDNNGETPFFKNLGESFGLLEKPMRRFLSPRFNDVEQALNQVGIKPEDVDYISYDHLHTQDVRKWLGEDGEEGYFPNAKLLVMQQEWASTKSLLPPQKTWYCPNGIDGVNPDKVMLLNSSVMLGDSVALIQTPGHTEGNHSLVAHTEGGLFVTSENGISAECYEPSKSGIKRVREFASSTGMEVVLNGNTLEGAVDQYLSMILEKTIAGPSLKNPDFPNIVTSSELTPYRGLSRLKPTFTVGELKYGSAVKQRNK